MTEREQNVLYGLGLGPGDPELLTLKAVRLLGEADVVICPQGKRGGKSIAMELALPHIKSDAQVVPMVFPMIYDAAALDVMWQKNAEAIHQYLKTSRKVVFVMIGDPTVYSTYMYMLPLLRAMGDSVETIPGITSFCASAARISLPLAMGDERFGVIPLRRDLSGLDEMLETYENLIVMKPSHGSRALGEKLIEKGLGEHFVLIAECGKPNEYISRDIQDLISGKVPYMSIILIKKNGIDG